MNILAERMKKLRLEKKLKQTEVAEAISLPISTYCSYEYGKSDPQTATLVKLAQLYQVSADYLLGLEGPPSEEKMKIILASNSPRRRELLGQMGLKDFEVAAPNVDESVEGGLSPAGMVEELSLRKARAAADRAGEDGLVIAADTVVALDGAVLGKPRSEADAFAMLSALSGREHHVYTGVTVLQGGRADTQHEETAVAFRELAPGEIWGYIATGEPMDKAGAYGIQGVGALLVRGIRGDYCNVVGLPVFRLGRMLAQFGINLLEGAGPQGADKA